MIRRFAARRVCRRLGKHDWTPMAYPRFCLRCWRSENV